MLDDVETTIDLGLPCASRQRVTATPTSSEVLLQLVGPVRIHGSPSSKFIISSSLGWFLVRLGWWRFVERLCCMRTGLRRPVGLPGGPGLLAGGSRLSPLTDVFSSPAWRLAPAGLLFCCLVLGRTCITRRSSKAHRYCRTFPPGLILSDVRISTTVSYRQAAEADQRTAYPSRHKSRS